MRFFFRKNGKKVRLKRFFSIEIACDSECAIVAVIVCLFTIKWMNLFTPWCNKNRTKDQNTQIYQLLIVQRTKNAQFSISRSVFSFQFLFVFFSFFLTYLSLYFPSSSSSSCLNCSYMYALRTLHCACCEFDSTVVLLLLYKRSESLSFLLKW